MAKRSQPGVTSPKAAEGSPHPASPLHLYTATRRVARTLSSAFAFGTSVRVRCMRVAPHPRHAPPGARQGPRRLGCASSPPLELGRRPSRAGRLASGAVRARCGPLSTVPARHGVRASRCTHATPTSRPSCLAPSSRSLTTVVLTSLKRGGPKAPSRLGRWAVRRFVCGRATRMASLASRGGTNLPPEGWLCTVGVYCEVCGRYGSRWRCLALPAWRYNALPHPELPKAVLARPRRLAASPPPEGWLVLYPPPLRSEPVYACDSTVSCCTHATLRRAPARALAASAAPPHRLWS